MKFEFATAGRILFGEGRLAEAGAAARELGSRALLVTGSRPARAQPLLDLLQAAGVEAATFAVAHEPAVDDVLAGIQQAHDACCDLVIAFGGGSAIDCAKAIGALAATAGDI